MEKGALKELGNRGRRDCITAVSYTHLPQAARETAAEQDQALGRRRLIAAVRPEARQLHYPAVARSWHLPPTGGQTVFKLRYAAIVHIITIFICGINTVDLAYQDIAHFLCMAPVSYTHLDVYKRQASGRTDWQVRFTPFQ